MSQTKLPLSIVIIVLNEEKNLRELLPLLSFASEVIVVDSGSNDQSEKVINEHQHTFLFHKFIGYGEQKRYAVSQTSNDWVLNLDADERPTSEFVQGLYDILHGSKTLNAYQVQMCDIFLGKPLKRWHGGGSRPVRLFKKSACDFSSDIVHERIITSGKIGMVRGIVHHYSYNDIEHYLVKFNNYTTRSALEGPIESTSSIIILLRAIYKFFDFYLLKGYIINGYPGFAWSLLASFYVSVKLIKRNEKYLNGNKL